MPSLVTNPVKPQGDNIKAKFSDHHVDLPAGTSQELPPHVAAELKDRYPWLAVAEEAPVEAPAEAPAEHDAEHDAEAPAEAPTGHDGEADELDLLTDEEIKDEAKKAGIRVGRSSRESLIKKLKALKE